MGLFSLSAGREHTPSPVWEKQNQALDENPSAPNLASPWATEQVFISPSFGCLPAESDSHSHETEAILVSPVAFQMPSDDECVIVG